MADQDQELELVGGLTRHSTVCEMCTPRLWQRLSSCADVTVELRAIANDLRLRDECARVLPQLTHAAQPAGDEATAIAMQPLDLVFPPPNKGDLVLDMHWRVAYVAALKDLPLEAVAWGISELIRTRTNEFYPKPGQIRALAMIRAAEIRKAQNRAKRALELPDHRRRPVDDDTRAAVKAGMADLLATLGARRVDPVRRRDGKSPQQVAAELRAAAG